MKRIISFVTAGLCAIALAGVPTSLAAENATPTPDNTDETITTVIPDIFDDQPRQILIDADSGKIIETHPIVGEFRTSVNRDCRNADACWTTGTAAGEFGFRGLGTSTGTWPQRNNFINKKYTADICYIPNTTKKLTCVKNIRPTFRVTINRLVTGKKVTLRDIWGQGWPT